MNIAEILKDCPKGTKLYSPLFGDCILDHVRRGIYEKYDDVIYVNVEFACCKQYSFDSEGRFVANTNRLGECLLFPSKDNRDWSTFKVNKECEFKPFDKVLVRDDDSNVWQIELFGWIDNLSDYKYQTITAAWKQCIPYKGNEHLLGTSNNPD